jgi:hypothetical protein
MTPRSIKDTQNLRPFPSLQYLLLWGILSESEQTLLASHISPSVRRSSTNNMGSTKGDFVN